LDISPFLIHKSKEWIYHSDNQKPSIKGPLMQWPKEKGQKRQTIVDKTPYRRLGIVRHKLRKNPCVLDRE
jgi:hypothetical protein